MSNKPINIHLGPFSIEQGRLAFEHNLYQLSVYDLGMKDSVANLNPLCLIVY